MRTRYGLQTLPASQLTGSEIIQLAQDTRQKVQSFVKTNNKETLLIAQNARLGQAITHFQEVRDLQRAKSVVAQLEAADLERDQALKTLQAFVRAHAFIKTESIQKAYGLMIGVLGDYRKTIRKSYEVQSAEVSQLLLKLKSPTYQQAIIQLGLSTHIDRLVASQTAFETLYKARLNEQAQLSPGQLKRGRKDLEKSYKLVVDLIAILSACQPDHTGYQDLLKQINAIRGRYKKRPKREKEPA